MQIPEILEMLFCTISDHTGILWWSRNSGPGFFDPSELQWTFRKFWIRCSGSMRNVLRVPGIVETLFWITAKENRLQIPEILEKLFCAISNRTEILSWSRNSGPGFFDPTELQWTFRKFWIRCSGSMRNVLRVPRIVETLFWITAKENRLQIPEILEKLFCAISDHTEILSWSRNSGPGFFDPTELQ
jgi:hypothetical protein